MTFACEKHETYNFACIECVRGPLAVGNDTLVFIDFAATAKKQKDHIEAVEDVVRTLVKFAVHDPSCERIKSSWSSAEPRVPECSCGLQKVYDRIDELIE